MSTLVSHVVTAVVVPFATDPVPAPSDVRPGWIALALTVVLVVATFLLWMNMRKQLGRINFRESEQDEKQDEPADGSAPTADSQERQHRNGAPPAS